MGFDDRSANRQSQTGALRFSGEECIEDLIYLLWRKPRAVIMVIKTSAPSSRKRQASVNPVIGKTHNMSTVRLYLWLNCEIYLSFWEGAYYSRILICEMPGDYRPRPPFLEDPTDEY